MFERFTEEARQVVILAQQEARTLNHRYIGTEHLLLGVLGESESLAARALQSFDITLEGARTQVARLVRGSDELNSGQIPFTPRAKKVLELSLREALSFGHNHIGPEHILLGVARENDSVAARILQSFGADSETVRNEVIRVLPRTGGTLRSDVVPIEPRQGLDAGWLGGLGPLLDRLGADIRHELGREPDLGDLLLVLACASDTIAARALSGLGVEPDAVSGTIERVRHQNPGPREELMRKIHAACRAKERAIEAQEFENAADLRDQERRLRAQAPTQTLVPTELLREIHRHLGIPSAPDDATRTN